MCKYCFILLCKYSFEYHWMYPRKWKNVKCKSLNTVPKNVFISCKYLYIFTCVCVATLYSYGH